jgi:hypothetical protein
MSDAKQASEAARSLVRHRWGSQVAEKAASVVISRAGELSPSTKSAVARAVADHDAEEGA